MIFTSKSFSFISECKIISKHVYIAFITSYHLSLSTHIRFTMLIPQLVNRFYELGKKLSMKSMDWIVSKCISSRFGDRLEIEIRKEGKAECNI